MQQGSDAGSWNPPCRMAITWLSYAMSIVHDDVIKWKYFPRYWPFVMGIHRSPMDSLHKGQWRRALMFSLICAWTKGWANDRDVGDLRRHCAHYDVTGGDLTTERVGNHQIHLSYNPVTGVCCNIGYHSETHLKLKSHEILFVHNIRVSCPGLYRTQKWRCRVLYKISKWFEFAWLRLSDAYIRQ